MAFYTLSSVMLKTKKVQKIQNYVIIFSFSGVE